MSQYFDPKSVNPLSLPSLPMLHKQALPTCQCAYFVISQLNEILYVGATKNLLLRWVAHHRELEFDLIGETRIAWLEISELAVLPTIEKSLIDHFKPILNTRKVVRREKDMPKLGAEATRRRKLNKTYKILQIRVLKEEKTAFDAWCAAKNVTMSDVVREAIAQHITEGKKLVDQREQ